jgi:hypothetical protein
MVHVSLTTAWLTDPHILNPALKCVCCSRPEILNGDVGGGFKVFKLLQVSSNYGVVQESQANYNYTLQPLVV